MANFNITQDERDYLQSIGGGSSLQDEKLYGFVPGRWLPNWVKQGYNQSIEGMAQQVVKGKPVFTMDQSYDPNMLEDIAATVVSFLTPTDFGAMVLGGGIGGLALKSATKQGAKQLAKSGLKKELSNSLAEKSTSKVLAQARNRAVTGATGLGFYSGLQSALGQKVTDGDIEFTKTLKDIATGAALGAGTGALNIAVNKTALRRGLSSKQAFAATKATESAFFGTVSPIIEGELPSAESYIHAAGVIGGMTLSTAAAKRMFKPKTRGVEGEEAASVYRESAKATAERRAKEKSQNEIWSNKEKDVKITSDWTGKDKDSLELRVRDVNKDGSLGKEQTILKKDFFASESQGGYVLKRNAKKQDVAGLIRSAIFKIKKKLNMDDSTFRQVVSDAAGKNFTEKISLNPNKAKKKIKSTNFDEIKNNRQAQERMLREMEKRLYIENEVKRFKDSGSQLYEVTGKSIFEIALPKPVYNILTSLKPFGTPPKDKRFQPIFQDVKKDYFIMDRDRATLTQDYMYKFSQAKYETRDGSIVKGLSKLNKKQRRELGEDLQNKNKREQVKEYRDILNKIYKNSEDAGIKVEKFLEDYFPRKIKRKLLQALRDDIDRFGDFDSRTMSFNLKDKVGFERALVTALETNQLSETTIKAIRALREQIAKNRKTDISQVRNSEAFERLRNEVFSEIVFTNKNLEVARKQSTLPDFFFEKDAGTVLSDYAAGAAKRISFVRTAGKKGEIVFGKIKALKDLGGHNEAEGLYKAIGSITGALEVDRRYNWSPKTKGIFNDLVNIQVATKIGLGFATIPNLTQSFISSVLKAGYGPFIKGSYKMITDKQYRKNISRYSGANSLELQQMLAGFNPSDMSFTAKMADRITYYSGFQGINKFNKLVSAYTGYEAALKWQRIAKTSKVATRREWAKSNLKQLGVDNINQKITQKGLAGAMYEFSRDTQLQRNVFREPLFFNDPRFQPFILFKRFGYRQFEWISTELNKELRYGNAAILLRLGLAGIAGGTAVNYARNGLADLFSGKYDEELFGTNIGATKDVYSEAYSYTEDGKNYTMRDFIDSLAAVGAAGLISDIIASESKWRTLEFIAKPAIIQDASKGYQALQALISDIDTFGPTGIVVRRSVKNIAPAFGSVARRVLERFETEGQRANYVKFRLGRTRARILDAMVEGDTALANRLIRSWNNSFPERIITYDDIGPEAINQRLMTKYKKQLNP